MDHALHMLGLKLDNMQELTYADRKRVHNLKYYTWVEQQGKTVEELNALWYDTEGTWDDRPRAGQGPGRPDQRFQRGHRAAERPVKRRRAGQPPRPAYLCLLRADIGILSLLLNADQNIPGPAGLLLVQGLQSVGDAVEQNRIILGEIFAFHIRHLHNMYYIAL